MSSSFSIVFPHAGGLADKRRFRIVFAEIFFNILVGDPWDCPTTRPLSGVGPRVIHRHFISQCIQVRSRETFDEVQGLGMRKAAAGKPKPLIEAHRIDDKSVALPE